MFNHFYNLSLDWRTPITLTVSYIYYSISTNYKLQNATQSSRKLLSLLTVVMVFHNIMLCMFSFLTFINTFPALLNFYAHNPLHVAIVDPHKELAQKLHFWIWIFYISKIYEIMDSFILHWNKKQTSFLQMYHHAGAIICCWMLTTCGSHLPWIFVVLNSFIHTLMYFYYLLMTVKIKVPRILKQSITRMQMVQFVTGTFIVVVHVLYGQIWDERAEMRVFQYVSLIGNVGYVAVLFVLFKRFERKTYAVTKKEKIN